MRLYHLTQHLPLGGTHVVIGSFSAAHQQELVIACGTHLHLYRVSKSGVLYAAISTPVFASIRSLGVFRLPATRRDYLVVTSDSGGISFLRAHPTRACFTHVHTEHFGRSGARRTVPGQLLACDPHGRALMVAALERSKFAYVLNRDVADTLVVSSPLDAHRGNQATFSLVALDVGLDNPMFAAIERSYEVQSKKSLVYYELDLGLNTVVRKLVASVQTSAYLLLAVPGDDGQPGGVLVCSDGRVSYRHLSEEDAKGNLVAREGEDTKRNSKIEAVLPFRASDRQEVSHGECPKRMVVCGTLIQPKNAPFFFLLCTELGDLIKVHLSWTPESGATTLTLSYFDSLPRPAMDLRILRSGHLLALIEGGDLLFMLFQRIDVPNDDPAGGFSSSHTYQLDELAQQYGLPDPRIAAQPSAANGTESMKKTSRVAFIPRSRLAFLLLREALPSFAPALALHRGDFTCEGSEQVVIACGRGREGAIRVLRNGLAVDDKVQPPVLPRAPLGIFAFREKRTDAFHRFIVLSFNDSTTVLRVGDENVSEISDSGLSANVRTLYAAQLGLADFVQAHSKGLRFVPSGSSSDASEWRPPSNVHIVQAAANNAQVLVALSNGDVVYFESADIDQDGPPSGGLRKVETISGALVVAGEDVDVTLGAADESARPALAIAEIPSGRTRSLFFAIGDGATGTVRVYRLDATGSPQSVGLHVAPAPVHSLAIVDFAAIDPDVAAVAAVSSKSKRSTAFNVTAPPPRNPQHALLIGTKRGALVRLDIDSSGSGLSNKWATFLGAGAVQLQGMRLGGVPTVLAMNDSCAWTIFPQGARIVNVPIVSTEPLQAAAAFTSHNIADGFVAASGRKLRFLAFSALHAITQSAALPQSVPPCSVPAVTALSSSTVIAKSRLQCTPRRLVPLFSAPKGAGGLGVAPQPALNGLVEDEEAARITKENRKGHDLFVVVETDHRAMFQEVMEAVDNEHNEDAKENGVASTEDTALQENPSTKKGSGSRRVVKRHRVVSAGEGMWASQLRLVSIRDLESVANSMLDDGEEDVDNSETENANWVSEPIAPEADLEPTAVRTHDVVRLSNPRECILCAACSSTFTGETRFRSAYVIASVARNLSPNATGRGRSAPVPGADVENELRVYKVDESGRKFMYVHSTPLEQSLHGLVHAMCAFRDRVLVGTGTTLRLYTLGKKRLLRKAEARGAVPTKIMAIATYGPSIFVADAQHSVAMFHYAPGTHHDAPGSFALSAKDSSSRWPTALAALDARSVAVADKFGSVTILRAPPECIANGIGASANGHAQTAVVTGAAHKLRIEAAFHVGAPVAALSAGRALTYATVHGAVGTLSVLHTDADARVLAGTQRAAREGGCGDLLGREHASFRAAFTPQKNVVDGDACEAVYAKHDVEERAKKSLTKEANQGSARDPVDVRRRLEELRWNA